MIEVFISRRDDGAQVMRMATSEITLERPADVHFGPAALDLTFHRKPGAEATKTLLNGREVLPVAATTCATWPWGWMRRGVRRGRAARIDTERVRPTTHKVSCFCPRRATKAPHSTTTRYAFDGARTIGDFIG